MTTMTAAQLRAQTGPMEQVPDPEVPERPRPPRTYPAAYKLRILGEDEQLDKAGQGALLRREGLYTSLISEWRKQRDKGALAAFTAPRGRPPVDPLQRENARLQRENAALRDQLERALVGGADASRPERAFRAASVAEPRRHVWLCDVDCGHEFWRTAGRLVSTSAENWTPLAGRKLDTSHTGLGSGPTLPSVVDGRRKGCTRCRTGQRSTTVQRQHRVAVGRTGLVVGDFHNLPAHALERLQQGKMVVITALAEGEGVGLDAGVQEGDLEGAVGDGAGLADQLVQPGVGDCAVARLVDVGAVGGAWWLAVEAHPEPDGTLWRGRSHDQVQVAGVEPIDDPTTCLVQHDGLPLHRPVTG